MIRAILNGSLANVETKPDPIFGVNVPVSCPEVPAEVLQPRNTWADKDAYDQKARELARRFNENFKKYESGVSEAVRSSCSQSGLRIVIRLLAWRPVHRPPTQDMNVQMKN